MFKNNSIKIMCSKKNTKRKSIDKFQMVHTLKVSRKNILTVESIRETAINLLLGLIFTATTDSSSSNVLV